MSNLPISTGSRLLREAVREPMLERDEERRLAERALAGDLDAAGRLIVSHLRYVIKIARGYRSSGLPMSDLIQQGTIGLIQAVQRFNPDRDTRLSTYAGWWIRAAIQDHVVRSWSLVRTGTTNAQKALFLRLRQMKTELMDGAEGLSDEIVAKLARGFDTTTAEVINLARRLAGGGDQSLDEPAAGGGNSSGEERRSRLDLLVCPQPNPEEVLVEASERRFVGDLIDRALALLPDRERFIIRQRYFEEARVTFEAIGRDIGLSKDRVRQLERAALDKLREALRPALSEHHPAA